MDNSSSDKKNRPFKIPAKGPFSGNKPRKKVGAIPGKRYILKKGTLNLYNLKKANRYFVLFFFVCTVILYGNTLFNKWAVDDNFVTGPRNELVKKGFAAIPQIFSSNYTDSKDSLGTVQPGYRPVVKMTFAIEYGLWGGDKPGLSHLINLLLYFWISTLLFFILRRLLKNYNILFPFLITLLFMAHPVHTEVVASLKNRDELLSFLCGLGGLHFFLLYSEKEKFTYVFSALIIFIIGYLSNPSILPFIALYPLVLYFFTDMKLRNLIWIFMVVLLIVLMAEIIPGLFLPGTIHVNSFIENPLFIESSFWTRTGTGFMSLLFYLRILVFPHPLLYYYGYNMIPVTGWGNILVMISFFIHLSLFIYAVRNFREKHILSFAILYYFIAITIYTNIFTPVAGIVGERFVFNASLGFIIFIVYQIFRIFNTDPKSLTIEFNERAKIIVIIVLLLIPCTAMTIKRNHQWHNLRDLYLSDINYQKRSVKANVEFANFMMNEVYNDSNYMENGIVDENLKQVIVGHFHTALRLYPNDYSTLNDIAMAYINLTPRVDSGIVFLKKAIVLRPELQSGWMNLAMAYRKKNNLDSSIICYQKVLQINPGALNAVFRMADACFEKGELGKAIKLNEDVIKTVPNLDVPYFNIGYYFIMQGDTTTAIRYWEQAAQRKPGHEVCMNLSMIYKARGDSKKAGYYYSLARKAGQVRNEDNNAR